MSFCVDWSVQRKTKIIVIASFDSIPMLIASLHMYYLSPCSNRKKEQTVVIDSQLTIQNQKVSVARVVELTMKVRVMDHGNGCAQNGH
jgi:hypothetical protein